MNVLIIGGTGFLSGAVVTEALDQGHTVSVVTRGSANRPAPPEGVESLTADRSDANALRTVLAGRDWDVVIDCVLFRPDDARAAADILDGHTGRSVFISTDFVYGGEPRTYPLKEDTPRHSLNSYGAQKAACEDVFLERHAQTGFPAVTLRPPHILGAGSQLGTGSREGRDPWLLWRLRNKRPIFLLDDGVLLIQPVHKKDIAQACFAVAGADNTLGKAYNIAGPDTVSTRRYYEIIGELIGIEPTALHLVSLPSSAYLAAWPDRAAFAQNRLYSTEPLTRDTGFVPSVSLRDALNEVITTVDSAGLPTGSSLPNPDDALLSALTGTNEQIKEVLLRATK